MYCPVAHKFLVILNTCTFIYGNIPFKLDCTCTVHCVCVEIMNMFVISVLYFTPVSAVCLLLSILRAS